MDNNRHAQINLYSRFLHTVSKIFAKRVCTERFFQALVLRNMSHYFVNHSNTNCTHLRHTYSLYSKYFPYASSFDISLIFIMNTEGQFYLQHLINIVTLQFVTFHLFLNTKHTLPIQKQSK